MQSILITNMMYWGYSFHRVFAICMERIKIVYVCLFGVYRPTREFFTHMETSPLSVKAGNILPMLGTPGH